MLIHQVVTNDLQDRYLFAKVLVAHYFKSNNLVKLMFTLRVETDSDNRHIIE